MKTKLIITFLLISYFGILSAQAPQKMSYQAVIRDLGNVLQSNKSIGLRISILQGSPTGTLIYQETYSPNPQTNMNGLVNVIIGSGIPVTGNFSTINWGAGPYYIKTETDPTGGANYTISGTSQLLSVPYALQANSLKNNIPYMSVASSTSTMDSALFIVRNTTGQVVFAVYNEGVRIYVDNGAKGNTKGGFAVGGFGTGKASSQPLLIIDPDSIRLYIDDKLTKTAKGGFAIGGFGSSKALPSNYFNVATDTTGIVNPAQNRILWYPLKNAFLTGNIIIEKKDSVGINSFSSGYLSRAIGSYSQAMGYQAISRSAYSTSIGKNSLASGASSFAFGDHSSATGTGSYAFGSYATASGNLSFALGSVGVDSTNKPTGKTIASGFGSFAAGFGSIASNQGSFTFGVADTASGPFATALGYETAARGWFNTSMGWGTKADGVASTATGWGTQVKSSGWGGMANGCSTISNNWVAAAFGDRTNARGHTSFATGYKTTASSHLTATFGDNTYAMGDGAIAMGHFTTAQSYGSLTIGRYNVLNGDSTNWYSWDPLFVAGNGSSTSSRSNAYTLYKDGSADMGSLLNVNNGISSGIALKVNGKEALWSNGTYFSWGFGNSYNYFYHPVTIGNASNPSYTLYVQGNAYATGSWSGSDIRWKKDLQHLNGVMPALLELNGYHFNWRTDEFPEMNFDAGQQIGLVAQEVERIFPELVRTDNKGYKAVAYDKLAVILLEGIKDQQKQIDAQREENRELRRQLDELKESVKLIMNASGIK
ncbi:MAG TPA: tail fiber domain-containing protein [Bacteroidales bacterium]|nr:tail fiber domain-containing protein [Bacteroidales bacterium]